MTAEFVIRSMMPADIERVKEISGLSFSRFMGFFAFLSVRDEEEGQTIVAEVEGSVVGFAKLTDFEIAHEKYGCILWIAVHPEFRRRGVANALTAEGISRLKQGGAKAIFASAQMRKTGALTVLAKNGFRRVGFVDLWRIFKGHVFEFYGDIWLAPGEVVLMHD